MTDSLLRRSQHSLAPVQRRDIEAAIATCMADPVTAVVPLMHLEAARDSGHIPSALWAVRKRNSLRHDIVGVVWAGANLWPILPRDVDIDAEDDLRADVAQGMVTQVARPAAVVGEASVVLDLWGRVEPWWEPARTVRPRQISMVATQAPVRQRPPECDLEPLRTSTLDDYNALLPACVHMFVGEVGYDPLRHGRVSYEARLKQLVHDRRSYVQYGVVDGQRRLVFKAELGATGGGVAQVQGVWTHPAVRGRGVGRAGMADLIRTVTADVAPALSLYVNDFNVPALATYRSTGFREVGEFATVMF
jgi:predicted GNAT family acetyltransferase